jgi:hypothetical protein
LKILDPTLKVIAATGRLAPRIDSLDDKVIGLVWNGYPGGDRLLRAVQADLESRYRIRGTLWRRKKILGEPAPREMVDELVSSCDVIFSSIGA